MRIVLSRDPLNIVESSAEIAIEKTQPECPLRTLTHSPVAAFQMRIVLSHDPLNIVELSAEIAIDRTEPKCPLSS